jgi:AraC family transcriptional regulator
MNPYEEKIKCALLFIESNLSKDLSWLEISKHCGISEYHFHRIFSARMKETPREYIIRRRLERSLGQIAYGCGEVNLVDIALHCGYSSQSNFTKAFKSYFGVTPGQIQKGEDPKNSNIGKIKSRYGKDFNISSLYPDEEITNDRFVKGEKMKVEIKDFKERLVIYSSSSGGYKRESIFKTWNDLMMKLAGLGNQMDSLSTFGVGHDNPQVTPEDKCRYDACILKDDLTIPPKDALEMSFPAGKYACFYYKGSSEKLLQFYLEIYSNWFPTSGQEPGNFPLIERYLSVDKENPSGEIEVETQFLLK